MICWIEPKGKLVIKSTDNTESFALRVLEQRYRESLRAHIVGQECDGTLDFIVFDHSYEQLLPSAGQKDLKMIKTREEISI